VEASDFDWQNVESRSPDYRGLTNCGAAQSLVSLGEGRTGNMGVKKEWRGDVIGEPDASVKQ